LIDRSRGSHAHEIVDECRPEAARFVHGPRTIDPISSRDPQALRNPAISSTHPSPSGRKHYPLTAGFYTGSPFDSFRLPCQCNEACVSRCTGVCGCFACVIATVDRKMAARADAGRIAA